MNTVAYDEQLVNSAHCVALDRAAHRRAAVRLIRQSQARVIYYRIECEMVWGMGLPDGVTIPSYRAVETGSGRTISPGWCDMSAQMVRAWVGEHYPHAQEARGAEA